MSDDDLGELRRVYTFKLTPEKRCESCSHASPVRRTNIITCEGRCRLLDIVMADVSRSCCPGWQSAWFRR